MAATSDKLAQYQKMPDTLCRSTPRFSFWGNLLPNGRVPIFDPKLEYKVGSDGQQGADKDPQRVIDKPGEYDKSVYLGQGEKKIKRATRAVRHRGRSRGANRNPEHLIVTEQPLDDIREVCDHPNSYGFDIVSTAQKLYCDMEEKQLYHVCDGQQFVDNCFDMEARTITPRGGIHAREELSAAVSHKNYTSVARWKT